MKFGGKCEICGCSDQEVLTEGRVLLGNINPKPRIQNSRMVLCANCGKKLRNRIKWIALIDYHSGGIEKLWEVDLENYLKLYYRVVDEIKKEIATK